MALSTSSSDGSAPELMTIPGRVNIRLAALCSAPTLCPVQCSAVLGVVLRCAVLRCAVLRCTMLHCAALCCTMLHRH